MVPDYRGNVRSLSLHRVAVLRPFAQFLGNIGAPVERGFRRAGLPHTALESVDNFVPSQRFWSFLVSMAQTEGIVDLGFRVGQQFGANSADPHLTNLLRQSLTLYQGLLKASELVNRTISNCRLGIHQRPSRSYSCFYHQPSCKVTNPAIDQISWFGITTMIGMVRVFTGPQWQPTEIGIMTDHTPCDYIRGHFPQTRIKLRHPYDYVTLENRLLGLPPLSDETPAQPLSSHHYESLPDDFPGALESILLAYAQERDLSIGLAAGLCDMSTRTLQRMLSELGTRFSEALAQARLRVACQMLRAPGMKVADIAQRLGYSDSAHFSRAFSRVAGVTPRAYRQEYIN